jgi:uncharacterized Zn finger protein (UPF0148 family)
MSYSHQVRILLCVECGAPLDAGVDGGAVRCEYCSCTNQVARRNEDADIAEAQQARDAALDESERVERLRQQDRQPTSLPESLAPFLRGSELDPRQATAAAQDWTVTRKMLEQTGEFAASERLFHLTLLVAPTQEPERRRAMVENAVELLPDRRHRQILRAELTRLAVRASDLESAEQWLRPCNSRSSDLRMDTAYRIAAAYLATRRGDYLRVLALLGRSPGDIPIADGYDDEASALRANATEAMAGGDSSGVQQARALLQSAIESDTRCLHGLDRAFEEFALAPESWRLARQVATAHTEQHLRSQTEFVGASIVFSVITLLLLALTIASIATIPLADGPGVAFGLATLFFGFIAGAAWHFRRKRDVLLRQGTFGFGEVLAAKPRVQQTSNSTTVRQALTVVIAERSPTQHTYSVIRQEPPLPGHYPCIFLPFDANDNFLLQLSW